jgi:hypothetical protein
MPKRETTVSVESLRGVAVLYEGDVHEIACLLLKLWAAKDRETNARRTGSVIRSMPTVGWLAMAYSSLVPDVSTERVKEVLVRHGLPLGATVEHDEAVQSEPPTGLRLAEGTSRRRARRKPPGE